MLPSKKLLSGSAGGIAKSVWIWQYGAKLLKLIAMIGLGIILDVLCPRWKGAQKNNKNNTASDKHLGRFILFTKLYILYDTLRSLKTLLI